MNEALTMSVCPGWHIHCPLVWHAAFAATTVHTKVLCSQLQVCVIREQRLDQEDIITDISKSCEQAKKEQETLKQKLKRIEQSLAATETDIREFQREKQASLNEIDVMVMLYAHQIEYLVDGRLPMDLSGAVVFSNKELERLKCRIHVRAPANSVLVLYSADTMGQRRPQSE
jgi:esterase/lipase